MITLADVIAKVETNDDCNFLRFEPTMFQNRPVWAGKSVSKVKEFNGGEPDCSLDTAWMIACTSWGRYQILGCNIYEVGFTDGIFDFVQNENGEQEIIFVKFVSQSPYKFSAGEDVSIWDDLRFTRFAGFYNGPGNVLDYVSKMKEAMK